MVQPDDGVERIRAAEVIGALCLATDLGMGFPLEHGLNATLTTMRLCDVLGVDSETAAGAYYACLLIHVGCTTNGEIGAHIFKGSLSETMTYRMFGSPLEGMKGAFAATAAPSSPWPLRAVQLTTGIPRVVAVRKGHFTAMCEVAEMLADQLGLPTGVQQLFPFYTERWDGWSNLRRAKGEEVPRPLRIVHVGWDAAYQRLLGGDRHAVETIRERSGHAFDPKIAGALVENAGDVLGVSDTESIWAEVLAAEPKPHLILEGSSIDRALAAMGAFSDLASPYLSGHSTLVGDLAFRAARLRGLGEQEARTVRRAGYVADLGKVAVHPRVWEKEGPLTADEWEQVRLHPYHTHRVLVRSSMLAPVGVLAETHHERLDGSGYPRSLTVAMQTPEERLLAAADAFHSKTEPRAYRAAYSVDDASRIVAAKAGEGRLDRDMVAAVVEAAGAEMPMVGRPAGLTERETEVLGLVARGMQTKQVARALGISVKTADRHIQNAYRKIGVSTRAAATLFAAEHGLVPWGERPIPRS